MSEDKKRFLVSLKPSDVRVSGRGEGEEGRMSVGERLEGFLAERHTVMAPSHTLSPGVVVCGKVRLCTYDALVLCF